MSIDRFPYSVVWSKDEKKYSFLSDSMQKHCAVVPRTLDQPMTAITGLLHEIKQEAVIVSSDNIAHSITRWTLNPLKLALSTHCSHVSTLVVDTFSLLQVSLRRELITCWSKPMMWKMSRWRWLPTSLTSYQVWNTFNPAVKLCKLLKKNQSMQHSHFYTVLFNSKVFEAVVETECGRSGSHSLKSSLLTAVQEPLMHCWWQQTFITASYHHPLL